ncbi:putative heterogeneous nuclear ribonucleoprotein U-like protein [Sesbania bispinosa]|nr:putative heterogeneous nuclear ribonucleoprotein U-like protein [Sesbania bispinosa]
MPSPLFGGLPPHCGGSPLTLGGFASLHGKSLFFSLCFPFSISLFSYHHLYPFSFLNHSSQLLFLHPPSPTFFSSIVLLPPSSRFSTAPSPPCDASVLGQQRPPYGLPYIACG